jgi:branched-chain amino acid transport system substrate-binding protein
MPKMEAFLRSAVVVALISVFCGGAHAQAIKVGVMGPYTGPTARVGEEIRNGTLLAIEDARAAGDLPLRIDGKDRDLELYWADEDASPEQAVKAFQDATARNNVDIMLNGWHSDDALALIDIEASANIIHFGHLGAPESVSKKIIDHGYTHWFKGWPAPGSMSGLYVTAIDDFIKAGKWKPSVKKAALVLEDTDWGRAWGDAIVKRLVETGWEVVSRDYVKLNESEFTALLTKYKSAGVTLIAASLGAVPCQAIVKQHYNLGLGSLLIADGLGWSADWYKATGEASDNVISMDSPRAITPEQQAWVKHFEEKYGHSPALAPAGLAYDYTRMLIKGLKAAGSLEKTALAKALLDLDYSGVWEHYAFAKKAGDGAVAPYEVKVGPFGEGFSFPMVQYSGGKAVMIWPSKFAQGDFHPPGK